MNMKIDTTYTVSFDGSPKWHIKADLVKQVQGSSFIKVRPYDESFCRFVVHDFLALPKRNRPSLAQCPGWKALLKCRNDAVAEQAKETEPEGESISLFGSDTRASKKVVRLNAAQLQDLRDNPEVMEFMVAGAGGRPSLNVSAIKPAHPCDDLYVPLDADSIEHLVVLLREHGIDEESLLSKRQYGSMDLEAGVWRNGGNSLVKKVDAADASGDEDAPAKRFRRVPRTTREKGQGVLQFFPQSEDSTLPDSGESPPAGENGDGEA